MGMNVCPKFSVGKGRRGGERHFLFTAKIALHYVILMLITIFMVLASLTLATKSVLQRKYIQQS